MTRFVLEVTHLVSDLTTLVTVALEYQVHKVRLTEPEELGTVHHGGVGHIGACRFPDGRSLAAHEDVSE